MKKEKSLFNHRLLAMIVAIALAFSLFGSFSALAEREYAAEFSILGQTVDFNNAPYSEYGYVFVPLEELCGYIGISFSKEQDMYTLTRAGVNVQVQVGNMYVLVQGVQVNLPVSPVERNGVLYVPAELFSLGFELPLSVAKDTRSADISPNVYTIHIDEQNAAAVSAQNPAEDVLATSASGTDILRDHMDLYPHKSSYVYYKANLDIFKDKNIESAFLRMTVKRNETGPSITAVRTAPWKKGEINWNNQPEVKEEKSPSFATSASGNVNASINILSCVNAALLEGEELSLKIHGKHRAGERNERDKHPYTVLGVNSSAPPSFSITLSESYTFPVKEADLSDKEESRYSEMELLRSLGVFTENDEFPLDLNEGVMRYEFIRYVLRLTNSQITTGAVQKFTDVPADAPFFDEVNTAYEMGLVTGDGASAFRPYDFITVGEAITVMGRALNYDIYAEEYGGFTPGYFAAAKIGRLYLGGAGERAVLSFNMMFNLLRNSLEASVLEIINYKSDGTSEYTFNENKNILTEYHKAKLIEGTVTANEYSNITPGAGGKEDIIVIGTKELKLNYEPYNDFLGYSVKGYYEENEDILLYIGSKEYDTAEINLSDIENTSETASLVTFTYTKENGKVKEESFLKTATVIYNGKSIASSDVKAALLQADGGSVKLVGKGLVIINAYRTVIVSAVDTENEVIYDKYDMYDRVLRLTDSDYSFKTADGEKADLANINVNDVLSVMQSADGKLISVIISKEKVQGTIEVAENITSLSDAVVTVNSKEYTLANITKPNLTENEKYWTDFIKLGTKATFLIDCFGSIVSVLETQTQSLPGYIVAMDYSGRSAIHQPSFSENTDEIFVGTMSGMFIYKYKEYWKYLDSKITITINDTEQDFSEMPVIEDGRVMVPMRELFEALDAKVSYNEETGEISARKGNNYITMKAGSLKATLNGKEVTLDIAPYITAKGKTMIPIRFAAEALDVNVGWNEENRSVGINA